jgi:pSer/pThr/pTyr-binding forkhead associated (FHA) protein
MDRPEDRLALIEWVGRDRHGVRSVDVHRWPVTLGRGLQNTIVLDDPQVAELHARLWADEAGSLHLEATGTRNGVRVGQRLLQAGEQTPITAGGAPLQLGGTTLRLRCPGEALAPEEVLPMDWRWLRIGFWPSAGLALLWLAMLAVEFWIGLDPGAELSDWLPFALGAPLGLVLWCTLWALGSKVFRHQFDFVGHLSIAAPALLAVTTVDWLAPQVAAMLGWPWLAEAGRWTETGLTLAMLWAHLRLVLPVPRGRPLRALNTATLVLALLGGVAFLTVQHRSTERWSTQPYLGTLPMPALRLDPAVPVDRLLESVQRLRAPLEARVKQAADDDQDDDRE